MGRRASWAQRPVHMPFADEIGYREPYTYFGGVLDGLLSGFC